MNPTMQDLFIGAATIYGEARGSSQDDRSAVAHAILNRCKARKWWGIAQGYEPHSISAVCRKPMQFSCWNANDPNAPVLARILENPPAGDRVWRACLRAMLDAVDGVSLDATEGATHYLTVALHKTDKAPTWSKRNDYVEVGSHRFFSGVT